MEGLPEADIIMPEVCQAVVVCDMCMEDKRPALKTCIKCEISMCAQHLQVHLTTPVLLQTHPLTEPTAPGAVGLGATKCPHHGKLVEYYCLDDLTCVCVSCAIEDQHRLHNMKTLSTAHRELVDKLKAEQKALAPRERQSLALERWEKKQREKVSSASVRLIEGVSSLCDIALTTIQSSVSARAVSIKTSKITTQAALREEDTFRFLQRYAGMHQAVEKARAVDLRKGLESGAEQEKLVLELQQSGSKILEQVAQLCGSLLALVDPENHQETDSPRLATKVADGTTELTFDPKALGKGMSLSQDHKKVFVSPLAKCATHTILCEMKTSNVSLRWMLNLSEDCDWTIGICDKVSAGNFNDSHVYALRWQNNCLSSLSPLYFDSCICGGSGSNPEKKRKISPHLIQLPWQTTTPRPQKIEVFWDLSSSSLSFYSRGQHYQRTELHRINIETQMENLTPFVTLEAESGRVVTQHNHSATAPWHNQSTWLCPCGTVHQQYGHIQSSSSSCQCGTVIGTTYVELFCELV